MCCEGRTDVHRSTASCATWAEKSHTKGWVEDVDYFKGQARKRFLGGRNVNRPER